ncbi:hypothetical protein [Phaeodactylibacter luteus]|uniref:hypothetical protein n=1 Tax=Phaeodactylibacter luteus TaxID=1564516 RepID=UPI0014791A48|nr:hypothetical protein [Phaeodactylibacter luteus]
MPKPPSGQTPEELRPEERHQLVTAQLIAAMQAIDALLSSEEGRAPGFPQKPYLGKEEKPGEDSPEP